LTSTDSPIASPTGFHEGCQEYSHVAHCIDPETEKMTTEGRRTLNNKLLADNSIPSSKMDQCSAPNVAAVWVATTFSGQNATNIKPFPINLHSLPFVSMGKDKALAL
jgi:hypothetical protein